MPLAHFEDVMNERIVKIMYTNHRGEYRERTIIPCPGTLRFTETPHHRPAQWVFDAWDVENNRNVQRTFALFNVHEWKVG